MVKDRRDVTRRRQERTRRHSAAVLNRYKVDQGCVDCGFNAWPEALHFDHIDPATKRTDLGWRKDRSKLTSFAKLARYLDHVDRYCEVRCANCHAHRTSEEQHWLPSGPTQDPTLF